MSGPSLRVLLSPFLGDEDDNSDWGRGLLGFKDLYGMMVFIFFPAQETKQNPTAK